MGGLQVSQPGVDLEILNSVGCHNELCLNHVKNV